MFGNFAAALSRSQFLLIRTFHIEYPGLVSRSLDSNISIITQPRELGDCDRFLTTVSITCKLRGRPLNILKR